ncbi:hypothetical protein FRB90_001779 [Tulasnella sp. 427]|nr:hypothetical protein FRB90_001779 [Tulasnella sp. 427]
MVQSKTKADSEAENVIAELRQCHDDLKSKLEAEAVEVDPRCDLYEEQMLDRGGYSDIYLGHWRPVGNGELQPVAVKHLRPKGIDLDHTEEAELHERMRKLYEAACGLQFLHQHNPPIVHSDIKPDNILVNDSMEAVLADFGQSRFIDDGQSSHMNEDLLLGTPKYMAPELMEDETAQHTLASDVYAFALVTLEVLSGRSAFYNIRMNVILAVQRGIRPQPPDHPNPSCQQIWPLLAAGWDELPDQRPPIRDFVRWLRELPDTFTSTPKLPTPTATESARSVGRDTHHLSRDRCVVHGKRYDIWQGTRNIGEVRSVAIKFLRGRSGQWAVRDDNQVEVSQIAQGLDYLHRGSYPMVHGHLIPSQVLIDNEGVVKICGFSYSTFLQEQDDDGSWSTPEDITSIRYTAPEVLNGLDHSTPSDVYSMAFVGLEVLSSTIPFPFLSGGALIRAVADGARPDPEQYLDAMGHCAALWGLFNQCLSLDPLARPSARTVQNAIQNRAAQVVSATAMQPTPNFPVTVQ